MRKIENKDLDKIGKALVKAGTLPTREIEKIVANPALFDSVRMRMALESADPKRRNIFRPAVTTVVGVALIVVAAIAFVTLKYGSSPEMVNVPVPTVPGSPEIKRSSVPDRISETRLPQITTPIRVERVSNRPSVKTVNVRRPVAQQVGSEGDFYAVSYAGDPNETERGGRIVRVDIPRSTLFAMGVNIPLENEAETVKADLLVGNDGVTRAIRVVK